ncbi:MAG: hypothetical protein MMC33_001717 [Icmadophila ericetorum]|nr:hypothetical protein [Icmadophila ericetorum]
MPSFWSFLISPVVFFFSIPLLYFAVFTSIIAFTTLFIRVLVVYIELFTAVIHDQFISPPPPRKLSSLSSSSTPSLGGKDSRSRRSSAISFQSIDTTGSITPRIIADGGGGQFPPGIYPSQAPLTRDFEGIGGWRFAGPDSSEDDSLWTTINSRLELPTPPAIVVPNPTNGFSHSIENFATQDTVKGEHHHHEKKKRHVRRKTSGSLSNIPVWSSVGSVGSVKATKTAEGRGKGRSGEELVGPLGEVLSNWNNASKESLGSRGSESKSTTSLGEVGSSGVSMIPVRPRGHLGRRGEWEMTSSKETETLK